MARTLQKQESKKYGIEATRPFLMFQMQLDSNRHVIPGLNKGRMSLWDLDEEKLIQRWVFTSSYDGKQNVYSWKEYRGLCPPNYDAPGWKMYRVPTNLIIQPGQPVEEGFLVYESKDCSMCKMDVTKGVKRTEIMIHEDKGNDGSYGCLVAPRDEWNDFKKVFLETCHRHQEIPLGVMYSW